MTDDITIHSESFKIRASEVDQNGKATLPAICSLFQEVAGNHALKLNFDITQLHDQNLTWVLHRMDIKIDRYPNWREKITIETWPAAGDALRAYRNYRILNEEGNLIGVCLSYWMMINLKTRKPTRMPKDVLDLRLSDIDHVLPVKSDRIMPFEETNVEKKFVVRESDLDMNKHVNNARFVEWLMETYNNDKAYLIKNLDIMFMQESHFGDIIISERKDEEYQNYRHQLKNQEGKILVLATCS
ncbi:MAG: acyl-[acyl-carrier-protein] thioesterase [Gracilimonas sp.]|uniref:acyl-[acyl-carrier-protein] thioesterase n=1 Tax=Gracilimonas sp. TaxID=1974203 RepID=UPI0019C5BD20|nr:acyl-ACP thioesterase domain-containing protein [Gracilimonas sp.]MBD3615140.1 acyl-[acyl-carrier-protein] thioesterase [Gracilimonas sp.]